MVTFESTPEVPYKIIRYLAGEGVESSGYVTEDFWKLMYYKGVDALFQPDLTFEEKMDLIYVDGSQEEKSIFFSNLIEDAIAEAKPILKIFNHQTVPLNKYAAAVLWGFEFLWGSSQSVVYNKDGIPCNRGDLLIRELFRALNGKYVGGVGTIEYDTELNRYIQTKRVLGDSKKFTGYLALLGIVDGANNCPYC